MAERVAPWIVFVCLAMAMFFDPGRDTLSVPSGAFAVSLSLAATTFAYARTMKEESGLRGEVVFAGERLLLAAAMFLAASILNHSSRDLPHYVAGPTHLILLESL